MEVKLGPDINTSVKEYAKGYQINIDTNSYPIKQIYMALAHEITHVSQKMNNFYNFQFHMLREKYKEVQPKNWATLIDSIHEDLETENEAVMVQIAVALKKGRFDDAYQEMLSRSAYFKTWSWKKFATKLYSVGAKGQDINKLQKVLVSTLDEKLKHFLSEAKDVGLLTNSVLEAAPL